MGRQALVTLDHVKAAVAALQAEGRNVSSRAVREKLGNVGSMGTINKLLQEFAENKAEPLGSLRQLPPDLQYAILDFVDHQAVASRQQIADELIQCRREMGDLAEANDQLTTTIDDLQDQLAHTMSEKASLKGQVAQLEEELTRSRADTATERRTAEVARIELIKVQVRIDVLAPLQEQLHDARAQYEAQRSASVRVEQAAAVLEAQRLALDNHVQYLNRELENAQIAKQKLAEKLDHMSELLDKERELRAAAERELAVLSATQADRKTVGNIAGRKTTDKRLGEPVDRGQNDQ